MKEGINMESTLGNTLRKIRQGKHKSICKIADENLSKSQISRFERGESEISCIRLINILDKLNISLEEFMIIHNSDKNLTNFIGLINFIREEYLADRIENIKKLLVYSPIYNISLFDKIMIKSIIHTVEKDIKPTDDELKKLTDYLFLVEIWGYYEIILLGNCARTLDYNTLFLLTKEMIRNYFYSSINKTNKKLVTQLAINCLIISIDYGKSKNCIFLIKEINDLLSNELNYYEKTVFLYARGYFEFRKNNKNGIQKMQQALQIFEILNEKSILKHYSDHFLSIIDKD